MQEALIHSSPDGHHAMLADGVERALILPLCAGVIDGQ